MEWVAKGQSFGIYIICTVGYIFMCFLSVGQLFWVLPDCLKKFNLDFNGDLLKAYVKPEPKVKFSERNVIQNLENLKNHDENSWECENDIDKDNLASSKVHQYNMGVSKNNHEIHMNTDKRHDGGRTADKFRPDMVAEGEIVVEIELSESIKESDVKNLDSWNDKYEIINESHDQFKNHEQGKVDAEVDVDHDGLDWGAG